MAERIADIDRARAAVERGSWSEAYELFRALDPLERPEDRERFADAAWWTGRIEESMAARQGAYTGYAEAGDDRRAAWMSARLCIEHFLREEPAVGAGWFARTQRHAKSLPDCVELGFASLLEATVLRFSGDPDTALPLIVRAIEIAQRFGDRDLLGMAIHTQGLILMDQGRVAEGRGPARRGDDLGGRRRAERLLHRRDLLQRDRGVPGDRRRPSGRRLGLRRRVRGRSRSRPSPPIRACAGSTAATLASLRGDWSARRGRGGPRHRGAAELQLGARR